MALTTGNTAQPQWWVKFLLCRPISTSNGDRRQRREYQRHNSSIFRQHPIGEEMADNWLFKAACRMEHIPNNPPVYGQHCKTAAHAWSATRDCMCVGVCAGRGWRWREKWWQQCYLCTIYKMHLAFWKDTSIVSPNAISLSRCDQWKNRLIFEWRSGLFIA